MIDLWYRGRLQDHHVNLRVRLPHADPLIGAQLFSRLHTLIRSYNHILQRKAAEALARGLSPTAALRGVGFPPSTCRGGLPRHQPHGASGVEVAGAKVY